jgi:hypothetical protein
MIVRVSVPESKLWSLLNTIPYLRRTHQANPRKDERVLFFDCPNESDKDKLDKAIASL